MEIFEKQLKCMSSISSVSVMITLPAKMTHQGAKRSYFWTVGSFPLLFSIAYAFLIK
jgi:hypothetical protein